LLPHYLICRTRVQVSGVNEQAEKGQKWKAVSSPAWLPKPLHETRAGAWTERPPPKRSLTQGSQICYSSGAP
jgi:hypothetical protein